MSLAVALAAVLAIALGLPAYGSDTSSGNRVAQTASVAPHSRIYNGTQLVGEIVSVGPILGTGKFGTVRQVLMKNARGREEYVALKVFSSSESAEKVSRISKRWDLLKAAFNSDHEETLNFGIAGLKLVTPNDLPQSSSVIISTLSDGSAESRRAFFTLEPKRLGFDPRLATISKFLQQTLSGITILSSHGLVHGDIKPANILYKIDENFRWESPNPDKIHFSLTDFDSVTPIGDQLLITTTSFSPPEGLSKKIFNASPAWDIYSLAISTYDLTFGDKPFDDYFNNLHPSDRHFADLKKERLHTYADPKRYAQFIKHVDRRFKELESQVSSPSARRLINNLHISVVNGLAYSPEERLNAFPHIQKNAKRFLDADRAADKHCDTLLRYLEDQLIHLK
jgi:serine/threonine protein kinase